MTLHNFIRRETITDLEFESYEGKEDYIPDDKESATNINVDENEASHINDSTQLYNEKDYYIFRV